MKMKPFDKRTPDSQYQKTLRYILQNGVRVKSQQGVDALTTINPPPHMCFPLENGFPFITERNIKKFWRQAVGEICAFINGARTLKELESFGCKFWRKWGTLEKCAKRGLETGDLGPGSYGAAFHDFPTAGGGTFNQFKHLIEQIREFPHLRTHIVTPFIPQYLVRGKGKQQKVVVVPCHGDIHVEIIDDRLVLRMHQRSADIPVGVPSNMAEYSVLTLMLAHVLGYEHATYIHSFSDAHIYVNQLQNVEEMLSRETRSLPTLSINKPEITNIFDFRHEHFDLSDYNPHPAIQEIPVAI